jgi:hypothetical protein
VDSTGSVTIRVCFVRSLQEALDEHRRGETRLVEELIG